MGEALKMDKRLRRKVLVASLIGASIEWFDFFFMQL